MRTARGRAVWTMGRADAGAASGDLQFADLPGLLRGCDGASLRSVLLMAPEKDQPDDRVVSVLRRVEPAVRDPAVGFHGRRLVGGAMDGARQAREHAESVDADQRRREPRDARLLQIWGVPRPEFRDDRGVAWDRLPTSGLGYHPSSRHQLLHLRHYVLHARRLFAALEAGRQLPQ